MAEDPIKLFPGRAETFPEPTESDTLQVLARAGLAIIPGFGGAITEVLSLVLAPAVERRRDEWFKELAKAVDQLEAKIEGFKVEDLAKNDAFVSATIQASLIAFRTHQQEKRKMLRNALVNIGLGRCPDEDIQHIYLQLIDEFTPSHVKILDFLWKGVSQVAAANERLLRQGNTYQEVLDQFRPEFRGKGELVQQVLTDLNRRGLSTLQGANLVFPQQVITNQGIAFLQFVLEEAA